MTEGLEQVGYLKAFLKIMPPILLLWPTMSEVDTGDVAVEVEHRENA